MPSRASGKTSCTACASTCAVECRSTASPSGDPMVTGSTTSPSATTCARSRSSPPTRATTTASGPFAGPAPSSSSPAVVPCSTCRSLPETTTVRWPGTVGLLGVGGAAGRSGPPVTMLSAAPRGGLPRSARAATLDTVGCAATIMPPCPARGQRATTSRRWTAPSRRWSSSGPTSATPSSTPRCSRCASAGTGSPAATASSASSSPPCSATWSTPPRSPPGSAPRRCAR